MELWIVGRWTGAAWEFQGVFDNQDRAIAACADNPHCFIGPATLNEMYKNDAMEWPGLFYPVAPPEVM